MSEQQDRFWIGLGSAGLLVIFAIPFLLSLPLRPRRATLAPPAPPLPAARPADTQVAAPAPVDRTATETMADSRGVLAGELYLQHCAACHGESGDGAGLAARFLEPKPRDFRAGRFRLVSTDVRPVTASRADIEAVLERGMPGSSMVSWAHLPDEHRRLLAEYVIELRRAGAHDLFVAMAEENGESPTTEEIREYVLSMSTAGAEMAVPPLGEATIERIGHGRQLFVSKGCAACHGAEGKGDGQERMLTAEGYPQRPRDLTLGIFKGNDDPASVFRRIRLGLPGSAMPSTDVNNLSDTEAADLVHFILSLSEPAQRTDSVMRRQRIVARRLPALADSLDGVDWQALPFVAVATTPLWWRNDFRGSGLEVRAAHDGQRIAIHLSWEDRSCNDRPYRTDDFDDMVSVQLFSGPSEPFLGMGSDKAPPLDVWLWKAGWRHPYPQSEFLMDEYPFDRPIGVAAGEAADTADGPDFLTARSAGNLNTNTDRSLSASSLTARGFGSLAFRPRPSQVVSTSASHADGRWSVVFLRPLTVSEGGGLTLSPGGNLSAAFAIWDGAHRDRDGQKQISIWNDLHLEP